MQWDQVIGQAHVVQTLRNAVVTDRVAHAYLFAGPRGTGKTTTARILAKAVNCLDENLANRPCNKCEHCVAVNEGRFLDLIEIDAASNTSVDDVRDLRDKINFSPNQGRYKVYIVDEVHMLSTAAFNALLKTLEEPPPHAIFVLATTEVHKIPATVLSRCQRHEFRRIPVKEIIDNLQILADTEKIQADPEALSLVARQATGSMRDAISLLDQLASAGKAITLQLAQDVMGTATSQAVLDVIEAIIKRQSAQGLEAIHRSLDAGSDPRQFARQIVDYLRSLLLVELGNAAQVDATPELRAQMARHSQGMPVPEVLRVVQLFNQAATDIRSSWQPALALEMAFVEAITHPEPIIDYPNPERAPGLPAASSEASSPVSKTTNPTISKAETHPAQPASPDVSTDEARLNQRLNANWDQFLALLKTQDANLCALVKSARQHFIKGSVLFLEFNGEFYLKKMENPAMLKVLQNILKQVIELELDIRSILSSGKKSTPPPEVDSDGMVASALRDLGGEIVDIQ